MDALLKIVCRKSGFTQGVNLRKGNFIVAKMNRLAEISETEPREEAIRAPKTRLLKQSTSARTCTYL